jgi:hypothetical protein
MVKFPVFVPDPVRQFVQHYAVDHAATVDSEGEIDGERRTERLIRLATDDRMKPAFAILIGELSDDEQQWRDYMTAAWLTRYGYDSDRERLDRARALRGDLATTATRLAELLREAGDIGLASPDAHTLTRELLRAAKPATDDYGELWRHLRGDLLGDTGEAVTAAHLRYLWSLAPDVATLVSAIATTAHEWEPREAMATGAAIAARERNAKTQYLRAFADKLQRASIRLTVAVKRAMASTACVAINQPDIDVSFDDVRKTLAGLPNPARKTRSARSR